MRDAECEKFSDGDLQPRVAGICMVGVDFHRHSAMVCTVEGERSRPRSRGKRLSAQPLVSVVSDNAAKAGRPNKPTQTTASAALGRGAPRKLFTHNRYPAITALYSGDALTPQRLQKATLSAHWVGQGAGWVAKGERLVATAATASRANHAVLPAHLTVLHVVHGRQVRRRACGCGSYKTQRHKTSRGTRADHITGKPSMFRTVDIGSTSSSSADGAPRHLFSVDGTCPLVCTWEARALGP
eukprot:295969-Prymnesium_polylepis.2